MISAWINPYNEKVRVHNLMFNFTLNSSVVAAVSPNILFHISVKLYSIHIYSFVFFTFSWHMYEHPFSICSINFAI